MHRGQYHPHFSQGLPQFINQPLPDPNSIIGFDKILDPKEATVIADFSGPHDNFGEATKLPRDIDERFQDSK